jgi:thiol-disulfide isomerase/thioredoxin
MTDLGTPANHFNLTDAVTGETVSLADFAEKKALVVMFICNHCPFVKHIEEGLARFGRDYKNTELGIVAIMPNDVANYADDAPEKMKQTAERIGYTFPYLYDETQEIAQKYRAACTPDFFLYDDSRLLVYRGQFDDARPGDDAPVTGADLRAAVDALLSGGSPTDEQKPSIGCNIKWKAGNEPDYFSAG